MNRVSIVAVFGLLLFALAISCARFGVVSVATCLISAMSALVFFLPLLPGKALQGRRIGLAVLDCYLIGACICVANFIPRPSRFPSSSFKIVDKGWPLLAYQTRAPEADWLGQTNSQTQWLPYGVCCNVSVLASLLFAMPALLCFGWVQRRFSLKAVFIQTTAVAVIVSFISGLSEERLGITAHTIAQPFIGSRAVFWLVVGSIIANCGAVAVVLTAVKHDEAPVVQDDEMLESIRE